jgi:hypothetical protein
MKTTIKTLSVLILAGTFAFTACKKKDDVVPETPSTTGGTTGGAASSAPVTPHLGDADGVMIASKANVISTVGGFSVSVTVGSAIANVYSSTGGSSAVDGGTIKANDSTLTKQSNNSYLFTPKSAQGISYGSNSVWSISGNSPNNVPAVSYTATSFPSNPSVNNITTLSKGSSFTMNTNSISNADSLCFQITSGSKTIYKMTNGFQTSYTFPSSEMGTLDNSSNAYLTVTAYKFTNTTVSSKKYYFINMNTTNRMVSVTN